MCLTSNHSTVNSIITWIAMEGSATPLALDVNRYSSICSNGLVVTSDEYESSAIYVALGTPVNDGKYDLPDSTPQVAPGLIIKYLQRGFSFQSSTVV